LPQNSIYGPQEIRAGQFSERYENSQLYPKNGTFLENLLEIPAERAIKSRLLKRLKQKWEFLQTIPT
jgi:hypothetical protein